MIDQQMQRVHFLPRRPVAQVDAIGPNAHAQLARHEVSQVGMSLEDAARYVACVGVPVRGQVVRAVGVRPGLEEASVAVGDEHLVAHEELGLLLEAHGHLVLAELVERAHQEHVVVEEYAAELHEDHDAPKVTSVIDDEVAELVEDLASTVELIELDGVAQADFAHYLLPIIAV